MAINYGGGPDGIMEQNDPYGAKKEIISEQAVPPGFMNPAVQPMPVEQGVPKEFMNPAPQPMPIDRGPPADWKQQPYPVIGGNPQPWDGRLKHGMPGGDWGPGGAIGPEPMPYDTSRIYGGGSGSDTSFTQPPGWVSTGDGQLPQSDPYGNMTYEQQAAANRARSTPTYDMRDAFGRRESDPNYNRGSMGLRGDGMSPQQRDVMQRSQARVMGGRGSGSMNQQRQNQAMGKGGGQQDQGYGDFQRQQAYGGKGGGGESYLQDINQQMLGGGIGAGSLDGWQRPGGGGFGGLGLNQDFQNQQYQKGYQPGPPSQYGSGGGQNAMMKGVQDPYGASQMGPFQQPQQGFNLASAGGSGGKGGSSGGSGKGGGSGVGMSQTQPVNQPAMASGGYVGRFRRPY